LGGRPTLRRTKRPPHGFGRLKTTAFTESNLQQKKDLTTKSQGPKLLDEIRAFLRLHHYSIHTERAYLDWVIRFVRFHKMRSRVELLPAESKADDAPSPPPDTRCHRHPIRETGWGIVRRVQKPKSGCPPTIKMSRREKTQTKNHPLPCGRLHCMVGQCASGLNITAAQHKQHPRISLTTDPVVQNALGQWRTSFVRAETNLCIA